MVVAADLEAARQITGQVRAAHAAGTLTKRQFLDAWSKLSDALGDGPEGEGLEALTLFAEVEWLEELGVL